MQTNNNNSKRVTTKAPSTPPWNLSDPDEDLAIQPVPLKGRQLDTTTERSGQLSTDWVDDEEEPTYDDDFPAGAAGGVTVESPRVERPRPLFSRPADPSDAPSRLPEQLTASGSKAWTISAPGIERAIQTLVATLGRTPTDNEIAQQLRISVAGYHQALGLLKEIELEIGIREVNVSKDSGSVDLMCLRDGLDSAVFLCLRSEMLKLFRNAVHSLPERERLVISLRYCEDLGDKDISLVLHIAESTVTRLSASAYLHLRARVFGAHETDYYVCGDSVRPADNTHKWNRKQTGPKAHVYICGGQSGWLPAGYFWECLGPDATYDRFFRAWLFINDERKLDLVRRFERRELKLEDLRGQCDL
jgi:hypothetical protein